MSSSTKFNHLPELLKVLRELRREGAAPSDAAVAPYGLQYALARVTGRAISTEKWGMSPWNSFVNSCAVPPSARPSQEVVVLSLGLAATFSRTSSG